MRLSSGQTWSACCCPTRGRSASVTGQGGGERDVRDRMRRPTHMTHSIKLHILQRAQLRLGGQTRQPESREPGFPRLDLFPLYTPQRFLLRLFRDSLHRLAIKLESPSTLHTVNLLVQPYPSASTTERHTPFKVAHHPLPRPPARILSFPTLIVLPPLHLPSLPLNPRLLANQIAYHTFLTKNVTLGTTSGVSDPGQAEVARIEGLEGVLPETFGG